MNLSCLSLAFGAVLMAQQALAAEFRVQMLNKAADGRVMAF